MAKGSNRQKKPKRIPQSLAYRRSSKPIGDRVATNPDDLSEGKYLAISFKDRHNSYCELLSCELFEIQAILNKLIKATQEDFSVAGQFLFKDSVRKSRDYSKLFSYLPDRDVLLEFRFTKPGRVFYYIENDIIYLVAVRRKHL